MTLRERAEIEKAFTQVFKDGPPAKFEVDVRSIRFPSKDMAIEEGFLRHIPNGPGLPSSSRYETVLVREGGTWLIARSREWAAHQDRLGDLGVPHRPVGGRAKGRRGHLVVHQGPGRAVH